ncbi:hypothetical protein FOZ63_015714, partial [Perkinsus olseni]
SATQGIDLLPRGEYLYSGGCTRMSGLYPEARHCAMCSEVAEKELSTIYGKFDAIHAKDVAVPHGGLRQRQQSDGNPLTAQVVSRDGVVAPKPQENAANNYVNYKDE